ncbi:hypothetical protein Sjap_011262 [Stephania japonica]|uniref:Uncharacterized protein n=1 Tax=Stephania japonica TaxID=461633 RepID=A0AAP0JC37_9MAGN
MSCLSARCLTKLVFPTIVFLMFDEVSLTSLLVGSQILSDLRVNLVMFAEIPRRILSFGKLTVFCYDFGTTIFGCLRQVRATLINNFHSSSFSLLWWLVLSSV